MFKKTYYYHVAYSFSNQFGSGFGSTTITLDKKIKKPEDVKEIMKYIKKEEGMKSVTIINWMRFSM